MITTGILRLIKKLKKLEIPSNDWGTDRIFYTNKKSYCFMYKNKPTSNINDVIHVSIFKI